MSLGEINRKYNKKQNVLLMLKLISPTTTTGISVYSQKVNILEYLNQSFGYYIWYTKMIIMLLK